MSPTVAPLPDWGALALALAGARPDWEGLSRPWRRDGDQALWLSRSAWSLAALADTFAEMLGVTPVIALPDYLCASALAPLAGRAELVFYPISAETLAPDWPGCATLPRFDLFVLVHYFGFPGEAGAAADFCADRQAVLIEDATHVLRPLPGVGEAGAVTLYSPHKLLAVPDGAVMVVRDRAGELTAPLVDAVARLGSAAPPLRPWLGRRAVQKTPLGRLLMRLHPGGPPDFASDPPDTPPEKTPALSRAAAALIAAGDLDAIAARRVRHARILAEALAPAADWMSLYPPERDCPPYRLVMRCRDGEVAAAIYARLRAAALPVESWPDLPAGLAAESAARLLRGTLLLLPCHQTIDAPALAAAMVKALGGGR